VTGPPASTNPNTTVHHHPHQPPVSMLAQGLQQRVAAAAQAAHANAQEEKKTLFILHIPTTWNEQDLAAHFGTFGTLTRTDLPKDMNGIRRDFGFVSYTRHEDAQRALDSMHGFPVQDITGPKKLQVNFRSPGQQSGVQQGVGLTLGLTPPNAMPTPSNPPSMML